MTSAPPPADGHHRAAGTLRSLLGRGSCVLAPETPDGLMARLVQQAGFEVACVTALGTALNRIGTSDAGLVTGSEVADNAARVIEVSGLPTVVDAASGFGNPINVRRTLRELVRAGAAAVMLDDAALPRARRGVREPIAPADMAAKLKSAVDAREDSGLVLVAAIDGSQACGDAELADRAALYRDAGADLVHVGTIGSAEQAAALAQQLAGVPLCCSLDAASVPDAAALGALGFRLALVPHCGLLVAIPAIEHVFGELARLGTIGHLRGSIADFREFTRVAGLPAIQQLEARYGTPDEQRTAL